MIISGIRAARLIAVLATLVLATAIAPALAQSGATSTIVGTVHAVNGGPIGGAIVQLRGVTSETTTTDAQGGFRFDNVAPGVYSVVITRAGFFQYIASIATAAGSTTTLDVALSQQSFTSLKTIARTSTSAPGHVPINLSTASIATVTAAQFLDQGQTQVMKVLNETPGIIDYQTPGANNGADAFSPQTIQIRGALPYETETLIDGHATPLSLSGTFDPSLLNPAVLQNVEIVKGPGSMPTEINYAIGGTVNFVTLQPTRTPQATLIGGVDTWGGISTAIRFTGSIPSNFLQWAFAYATDGAPGPMQNYRLAGSSLFTIAGSPSFVDGQEILLSPVANAYLASPKSYNEYITPVGFERYGELFYVCCYPYNTDYDSKNELGKLKFNFSQSTSLTVSFLGAQDFGHTDNTGVATSNYPVGNLGQAFSTFQPPPWYSGSVPAGTPIPFDLSSFAPGFGSIEQYLYQGEFRTTLGAWTALVRYYDGGSTDYTYFNNPSTSTFAFTGNTWGGTIVCPKGTLYNGTTGVCNPGGLSPVPISFNGQLATFTALNATNSSLTNTHQRGESLQFDRPFGNGDDLTLSVDRTGETGFEFINIPTSGLPPYYSFAPGSSQQFTTEALRFTFLLTPQLQAEIGDYAIQYASHFTDNGGGLSPNSSGKLPPAVWKDATRGYNAPRIAFTFQPNDDTSWRLAAGYSIAPPFLSLLSSPGTAPGEIINGLASAGFIEDLNNGNIAPETALGVDIGVDHRFFPWLAVSLDGYLEDLRNQFLPSTFLINQDYYPAACSMQGLVPGQCPLYGSSVENLGHARYEGIEAAVVSQPVQGFGFRLQGSLMRAYAYDLPPGFYCVNVPASQCTPVNYDTNLGILPNVNYEAPGLGFNTLGNAVPYAMGYGELNWRMTNGSLYYAGVTYYGNNNALAVPAFAVVSAGIREQIGSHLALVLTGDNLNGADNALWANQFGGVATPLAPECVGKYGGPAYGAYGSVCAALLGLGVPRSDVSITSQLGPTGAENYGPTSFRLQLIDQIGSP